MLGHLDLAADDPNSPLHQQIQQLLPQLRNTVNGLVINQANFYPVLP